MPEVNTRKKKARNELGGREPTDARSRKFTECSVMNAPTSLRRLASVGHVFKPPAHLAGLNVSWSLSRLRAIRGHAVAFRQCRGKFPE